MPNFGVLTRYNDNAHIVWQSNRICKSMDQGKGNFLEDPPRSPILEGWL